LIEFAKVAVFSEDTALVGRYGAEGIGVGWRHHLDAFVPVRLRGALGDLITIFTGEKQVSQSIATSERIAFPREIAGIRIPDSALAQKAMDLAFRVSPTVVWTHVVRTFVFGALVGRAQKLRYDEELFFLASVLHDLGLTAEFRGDQRFEVVGADAADSFLKGQGVEPDRREIIWDAIALHTSVGIASRKRPEIALVHIGAGVDVVGLEVDKLPPELVAQTIEALPRHDFNKAFFSILVDTIAQAPQSAAMTWMCETANEYLPGHHFPTFAETLKTSPFRE
jgi:hypothetical protein